MIDASVGKAPFVLITFRSERLSDSMALVVSVNGGVKVRRVADQNRGTQALFTPLTAGCQTFFIS